MDIASLVSGAFVGAGACWAWLSGRREAERLSASDEISSAKAHVVNARLAAKAAEDEAASHKRVASRAVKDASIANARDEAAERQVFNLHRQLREAKGKKARHERAEQERRAEAARRAEEERRRTLAAASVRKGARS